MLKSLHPVLLDHKVLSQISAFYNVVITATPGGRQVSNATSFLAYLSFPDANTLGEAPVLESENLIVKGSIKERPLA